MGGREAIRGFAIQTLVCILDSLRDGRDWSDVTIEPDSGNEKVDVIWTNADGSRLAQQVKSSKNQISKASVVLWCSELKQSQSANKYQLILSGPVAATVLLEQPFDDVEVPTPASFDALALIDQAMTGLDRFLDRNGIGTLPLALRESIVHELSGKLLIGSIHGKTMGRSDFEGWLFKCVLDSYPQAISQRLSENCVVLWNFVELSGEVGEERSFEMAIPLTVVNGGAFTAVIEGFLLRVRSPSSEMRYVSSCVIDSAQNRNYMERRLESVPFGDIAVLPNSSSAVYLVFSSLRSMHSDGWRWSPGNYKFELLVKYSTSALPVLVRVADVAISHEEFSVFQSGATKCVSLRGSTAWWTFD
jgi:hypothetical protein